MDLLYHGTGARRKQSIQKRGLLPKLGSYVYASPHREIAAVFATARGELEDDWGLIVSFECNSPFESPWELDLSFPFSVKSKSGIEPASIMNIEIVDPREELKAAQWISNLVKLIRLEDGQRLTIVEKLEQNKEFLQTEFKLREGESER